MASQLKFSPISNSQEEQRLGEILAQCFNVPTSFWSSYRDRVGLENFRVLRQSGNIAGGLAIYSMGQWFGGQSVPMAGLASVAILPEYRGGGMAVELLKSALQELYDRTFPLSALYPAVPHLYRKVGYEQGGSYCQWELPLTSIPSGDRDLPLQAVDPRQHQVFHDLYRQLASRRNGYLDRSAAIWQSVVEHEGVEVYAYQVGRKTQSEGYIIFSPKEDGYLRIWDWVALTPRATNRILTFLSDCRSQIKAVRWMGSSLDPLVFFLPEQRAKIRRMQLWKLRIIHVTLALEQRGYPVGIETELHLSVCDNLVAENSGNYILTVSNGKGEVRRGGRGELQLDIRAFASLYTGLYAPEQLQQMGQLEASDGAMASATLLFGGSQPSMVDFF